MARYDTGALFDDGVIYDATVGVLVGDEEILAGESPALPDRRVVRRDAAATVWAFDPVAWLPTEPVENVAISATRGGTLGETGRQTETLTFDFAASLPFVAPFGMSEGDWFCVQWSVETTFSDASSASTTFLGGVFRLQSAPSSEQDDAGITWHCEAVDWFSYITTDSASTSGWLLWADLAQYVTDYLAAGGTAIPDGETGLATALAAWLWFYTASGAYAFGHIAPFHVEPWSGFRVPVLTTANPNAVQVTSPGQPCRLEAVLSWWWPLVAGYTLAFHADGGLLLSGRTPVDSGLYVTLGGTPLSSVPLPAEAAPLTLASPPYVRVTYQLVFTPPTIAEGGGIDPGGTIDETLRSGQATALYWVGSGTAARVEQIIDTDHPVTLGGFEGATAWCQWRLQEYLGAAQTIALTVDSCCPVPPLGRLVAVELVADDLSWPRAGWYRLVGFTQPLHVGNATWTLQWWALSDTSVVGPPAATLTTTEVVIAPGAALHVQWSAWSGTTGADFVGISSPDDPSSTDTTFYWAFTLTGGGASGATTISVPGSLDAGVYQVRGVYGGTTVLFGPLFTVTP